jgi:hypothetical protein
LATVCLAHSDSHEFGIVAVVPVACIAAMGGAGAGCKVDAIACSVGVACTSSAAAAVISAASAVSATFRDAALEASATAEDTASPGISMT